MTRSTQPIATPLSQKMLNFRQRQVPALVWGVAIVLCTFLLGGHRGRADLVGLAQAPSFEITSPTTGQVETLLVELYDEVEAGQVLARLDDDEISARLERSRAKIRQLIASLEARRARVIASEADRVADLRRFQMDEEQRKLRSLELAATLEADAIELHRLALERKRIGALYADGLVSADEYDRTRLTHDEAARRYESNGALLAALEAELAVARERRVDFQDAIPLALDEDPTLTPLREAIDIERYRLEEIRLRREALVLRSPVAGHVSGIRSRQGQTVVDGDPIVTVTENTVTEIVAFLDEANDRPVTEHLPVRVSSAKRPGRPADTRVIRLGQSLEVLPRRLWRTPDLAVSGRAVVIAAVPELHLVPGELVRVELLDPGR